MTSPLHSDCAFTIGAGHAVCQDYALAHDGTDATIAILCDGCSSSPVTDMGARLLAHVAKQELLRLSGLPQNDDWVTRAAHRAARQARLLGLCASSLDATLLGIAATPDGQFATFTHGDGVLALGHEDGTLEIHDIRYSGGYPDYPGYCTDAARYAAFAALQGNERVVTASPPFPLPGAGRGKGGEAKEASPQYRFAAVLSDGVHSFQKSGNGEAASICYLDIVRELLAFKSFQGAFVRRRLQRFLKDAAARGWRHHDDLSLAVVYFGE